MKVDLKKDIEYLIQTGVSRVISYLYFSTDIFNINPTYDKCLFVDV